MGSEIADIDIIRQTQTAVRGPDGENRFITIVGSLKITSGGDSSAPEIYHCLIGPTLEPHQVLGVSFLPSIAALDADLLGGAECSMDSYDAEYDADSGRVEISLEMRLSGTMSVVTIVFSLTILAAA
ncbi:MAG TPA: hypothetical protein VFB92_08495 [Vicinamibacterales bacterium]|nr:hypothetical protein [Vicinamibacterales bacterium]